jgi:hypothetical protein
MNQNDNKSGNLKLEEGGMSGTLDKVGRGTVSGTSLFFPFPYFTPSLMTSVIIGV